VVVMFFLSFRRLVQLREVAGSIEVVSWAEILC
jgi:hypothetical protein